MRQMKPFEPCPMPEHDCAAIIKGGLCRALTEINYCSAYPCPFYKPKAQNDTERARCYEQLVIKGRFDLLTKYKITPPNAISGAQEV